MSHFGVLVIGGDVEKQLAPYHEYECTAEDDEYVIDVDITADALEQYEKSTELRLKDPQGNLHEAFDAKGNWKKEFSEVDADSIFSSRHLKVPDGWERVDIPSKEAGVSFEQFVKDYYGIGADEESTNDWGHLQYDEDGNVTKVYDHTNPNKKWDWYVVGGRWSGHLLSKDGYDVDQLMKKDLDIEGMRAVAAKNAAETYDKASTLMNGKMTWAPWDMVREELFKNDIDGARKFYNEQLTPLKADDTFGFFFDCDEFLVGREAYIEAAKDKAIVLYSYVKDGEWHQRGEMGWFGMSHDEVDRRDWNKEFTDMIMALPDDTLLTVVDCHI
jgi:hypothetical protein